MKWRCDEPKVGFTLLELNGGDDHRRHPGGARDTQYKNATRKAMEAVLREDLWVFRDIIDQYKADKGEYPTTLEDLVTAGYLRKIPVDPVTRSADTWVTVPYEPPTPETDDDPTPLRARADSGQSRAARRGPRSMERNYADW